ncbi:RNA polymerase sigma factor [Deinococcus pimensis]|uniref:RNA polymerase sigma factor n=1 Tax=Deinococcus pimensis TaxID=309888 RepID=UPI0004B7F493|nr:sigma-70 family RNA polymerase sigma factor [Deinococcus pimensis]
MDDLTDPQLVALAVRDDAAFETLARRHLPRVRALAQSMVGVGAADDVVQEVLVSVHRNLRSFRGDAQFSTWLHRIVLNACYRALRARPTVLLGEVPEPVAPQDPALAGETAALRERLARAMSRLPREQREAVALRELSGLEYAEIAELTGVELGTVKSRINRGRAALRALLLEEGVTPSGV